jgi:D-alanyl-D-alanine carboxypeptidase
MTVMALALLLVAVDPRVDGVVKAIGEPGCPRLFPMLAESFQRSVPAREWPPWCAFVGTLGPLESRGTKDGWLRFRGGPPDRRILLDVAFDGAGKVSGLMAVRDVAAISEGETRRSLAEELAKVREQFHLPGLSTLVLRDGRVAEVSAVGVRKLGDATAITPDDRWHLGSDTKAMTATLAAILVEEKRIGWDSTVGQVLGPDVRPELRKVTLEMLLAHRGGIPEKVSPAEWDRMWQAKDHHRQRQETVRALLRAAPEKVGAFLYSNFSYLVADAMLEKVTGQPWELSIRKRLFQPLKMDSCSFGPPASTGKVDHPWAHRRQGNQLTPVPPGPQSDNPPSLGPAGTVHCTLRDWSRFIQMHLDGARATPTLVSPPTMTKLHTPPPGGNYALGWITAPHDSGTTLSHDGSNTLFFARVWMLPAKNVAFLVVTNAAGEPAVAAADRVTAYLRARYVD